MLESYKLAAEVYLTLPKDVGFDYMETVVAEMEEDLEISWTEAYKLFCELTYSV